MWENYSVNVGFNLDVQHQQQQQQYQNNNKDETTKEKERGGVELSQEDEHL